MAGRQSYAVTAAVWLGALVIVGVPTTAFVAGVLDGLYTSVAGSPVPLPARLALSLLSLAAGLAAADQITRVRLHGWAELRRGPPGRRLLRHAVLLLPVAALLWAFGQVLYRAATESARGASVEVYVVLLASVGVGLFVVSRAARSFLEGYRGI